MVWGIHVLVPNKLQRRVQELHEGYCTNEGSGEELSVVARTGPGAGGAG